MFRIKNFLTTTIFGGVLVLLPIFLTFVLIRWLFNFFMGLIRPLTETLMKSTTIPKELVDFIVIGAIIILCFGVGLFVRTRFGKFLHGFLETRILKVAPGYSLFKETIKQFLGQKKRPFSSVALARPFNNDTMVTTFVTDEHADGSYTVYMPSGLNPTTGLIFHLPGEKVHILDVGVEETLQSVIGCGSGSGKLISADTKK